jgi:ankyrin repeat protein
MSGRQMISSMELHGCAIWRSRSSYLGKPDVEINARNNIGSTPLIAAVISSDIANERVPKAKIANRLPVLRALLSAGAKYRLRDYAGHSAMY